MGTSTRKKIKRLKEELDKIEYDENNNITLNDFKRILSNLLFPHGRASIQCENIIKSTSSEEFSNSIKKIINFSNNYRSLGISGFGIPGLGNYSFKEQVDLISDVIVESENPELKQTIKDIIYANGIEGTFENTTLLIMEVFKKYIERKIQGNLVEEFAERNSEFTDKNFYILLDSVVSKSIINIMTADNINKLVINYQNDSFLSEWTDSTISSILKGVTI